MAIIQKIFAYNPGAPISGTTQYNDLVVGNINTDYSSDYGGVKWWGGPNEDLRYIIGNARPGGQPVPSGATGTAQVGFWGTPLGDKTDGAFLNLANYVGSLSSEPPFATTNDAVTWLNANGYYTSYTTITPTPTETIEVTPTPSTTNTPTPSVTNTQTPSVTPTLTPTPSTTPIPVTGYGYNLVVLPYAPPTSGNTIFPRFTVTGVTSGVTTPNTFNVNGVFWNAIDNLSVNRISYYSGMTGTSVTAYFTQNGDTAIYSGSSTAFTFEGPPGQQAFNYNPNARPSQLVLIQSASTDFVTGQTVYISYVVN